MFDVGFSEMMVIGVVALIVIGPDRLPKVAKTVGHLVGRMQRYVADVKADINREVEMSELKDLRKTMDEAAATMNTAMSSHANAITEEVRNAEQEVSRLASPMLHFGLTASAVAAPVHQPSNADAEPLPDPVVAETPTSVDAQVATVSTETASPEAVPPRQA